MYRLLLAQSLVFLYFTPYALAEPLAFSVKAEAAILMNADTGAILYEKNAHTPLYPASITKIATACYTLNKIGDQLDTKITAEQEAVGSVSEEVKRRANYSTPSYILVPGGTHIGIKKGEILSLRDLLYGMMLASGNDAANVIAQHVGGTIPQFMTDLNSYLQQIGCLSTSFLNPHGLHHPKHQTTAYDMAILTKEALKNPGFREIVSTIRYTRPKTNKQEASTLVQGNRLLRPGKLHYSKAIGVKTGFLTPAGNTLVGAAKDGDRTLIAVLLKVEDRKDMFLDAVKMFETAFNQPKVQRSLLKNGPQKFSLQIPGAIQPLITMINENVTLDYYPAEEVKVKCFLSWDNPLQLPILKDQRVGELVFKFDNGEIWRTVPLYSQETVEATGWQKVKDFFSGTGTKSTYFKGLGFLVFGLFVGFFILQLRRR